ncbi:MAG TPA: glycosyltransferase [Candidatus Fimimorpha excrementavium]|nr:glycosyltransferase [Candidatus Fimimorpha excrementavium]
MKDILYLVVPCYNEEDVLPVTAKRLAEVMEQLEKKGMICGEKSRILFVNDGSKDRTWALIQELHESNPSLYSGLCLTKNRGHQNALLAGLMEAKNYADAVISLDADLQDDVNAIEKMMEQYRNGFDIVYGVRSSRKKDTWFKRNTALGFYRFMKVLGVDIVYNHADYRLMSRRALCGLAEFQEVNLFLRGLVPLIGYPSTTVEYERKERFAGESKYPLKKMLSFAFDGITSFSVKPIRFICALGVFIFSVSVIMLIYFLIIYWMGKTVAGWATIVISIWAIGGLQLLAIGVIGEYIGKVYLEVKRRPRYLIAERLHDDAVSGTGRASECGKNSPDRASLEKEPEKGPCEREEEYQRQKGKQA